MSRDLIYLAGEKALADIRRDGLSPERVAVMAGAAGGPKGLVLGGLDHALFTEWFPRHGGRKKPLFLLGNSIAAWRFAALSRADAPESLRRFHEAYIGQFYVTDASPENVTREARRGLNAFMDDDGAREVLSHPFVRLSFLANRARGYTASRTRWRYVAGMALAGGVNALCRPGLGLFFERTLFYDDRLHPPFWDMPGFSLHRAALTSANLRDALLASGSIPLVMTGVTGIQGAPAGVYYDGGLIDYHLDVDMLPGGDGIVLYPHFTDRVIPGWLDKHLKWRKSLARNLERVLLVVPSPDFVRRLPLGKIPDRTDFARFHHDDARRRSIWRTVIRESHRLGERFLEDAASGRIRSLVQPLRGVR